MNRDEMLNFLRESRRTVAEKYKAEVQGIFGSYARGEEEPGSDVDILVEFKEGASLFDLVDLADFLEENFQRSVDIVSTRALRKEIEPSVRRDLVPV